MAILSRDGVRLVLNQRPPDPVTLGGHLTLTFPVEEYKGSIPSPGTLNVQWMLGPPGFRPA